MKTKDFAGIRNNGALPNPKELEIPSDTADMLPDYMESTNSQLEELEKAVLAYEAGRGVEENAAVIRRVLHKIKGESGMMGIDDVSNLCHQAEFAFEELAQQERADMLFRFKDWISDALEYITQ